jgi:ATP-dependent DNA helicase RecG
MCPGKACQRFAGARAARASASCSSTCPGDSREARTVAALRAGEQATVAVEVRAIAARPVRRRGMRPLVEATVFDATGSMRATFFNQPWLVERYPPGTQRVLHGKADSARRLRVAHHAPGKEAAIRHPDRWARRTPATVAHYPADRGRHLGDVLEALPAATRVSERLPDRASALAAMHFPRRRGSRDGPPAAGVRGAAADAARCSCAAAPRAGAHRARRARAIRAS